jgi:hypothetical protein
MAHKEYGFADTVPAAPLAGEGGMPAGTGYVSIDPWGTIEWVRVMFGLRPDTYRVIYDGNELFTIEATMQEDLLDKIHAAWRQRFPQRRAQPRL